MKLPVVLDQTSFVILDFCFPYIKNGPLKIFLINLTHLYFYRLIKEKVYKGESQKSFMPLHYHVLLSDTITNKRREKSFQYIYYEFIHMHTDIHSHFNETKNSRITIMSWNTILPS